MLDLTSIGVTQEASELIWLSTVILVAPQFFREPGLALARWCSATRFVASSPTMCRNIRQLFNFEPPATEDEVRAAAIQFVRKVTGSRKPTATNELAFEQAVDDIAGATSALLAALVTAAPPKDREEEKRKGRERWQKRAARIKDA